MKRPCLFVLRVSKTSRLPSLGPAGHHGWSMGATLQRSVTGKAGYNTQLPCRRLQIPALQLPHKGQWVGEARTNCFAAGNKLSIVGSLSAWEAGMEAGSAWERAAARATCTKRTNLSPRGGRPTDRNSYRRGKKDDLPSSAGGSNSLFAGLSVSPPRAGRPAPAWKLGGGLL
jgi:hypothetical protein